MMKLKVEHPPSHAWKDPSPFHRAGFCTARLNRMPGWFCSASRTSSQPASLKICNVLTESESRGKNFVLKTERVPSRTRSPATFHMSDRSRAANPAERIGENAGAGTISAAKV
jgi:hypothetical protein